MGRIRKNLPRFAGYIKDIDTFAKTMSILNMYRCVL